MRWILLLRAVNLGPTNKLAMKDLKAVLEGVGHTDVKTYLNSGNATFDSPKQAPRNLAQEVEKALHAQLDVNIRACVRTDAQLRKALEQLPELPGYVVCSVLFDQPASAALKEFLAVDWAPEVVRGNDQVLYVGFQNAARSKLTTAKIENALGVACTARTPTTLRKLLTPVTS